MEITALDDNGQPTEQKAQPVIGIWSMAAPEGTRLRHSHLPLSI
jgi:hypothetical protein